MILFPHQKKAIQASLENDFQSGIHFSATGTGKTFIALQLILEFHQRYPMDNVLWICEHQSILRDQFQKKVIQHRGFQDIFRQFLVLNYAENKQKDWVQSVNSSRFWSKPALVIINRPFLTSDDSYKKLRLEFSLLVHDECHTLSNRTTRAFYDFMTIPRCIGFSATPTLENPPLDTFISRYSIYDAFHDGIIVAPKIQWIHSSLPLSQQEMMHLLFHQIQELPYQKIILWCGMIHSSYELAEMFSALFTDFLICVDTGSGSGSGSSEHVFGHYDDFVKRPQKALLFCACKHREGSDIPNLDGCVFLDRVPNRNPKTFIQSLGRVLRHDTLRRKQFGLMMDLKAKNSSKIMEKLMTYLHTRDDDNDRGKISSPLFVSSQQNVPIGKKTIVIHSLLMTKKENSASPTTPTPPLPQDPSYLSSHDIIRLFRRPIPQEPRYLRRLSQEMELLEKKKVLGYLSRAVEILDMTENMPHVTRGSCGSSLVCYLLGISHTDPVLYNIRFARFLNEFRNTLPDIDYDFPHHLREDVFIAMERHWPDQVVRISNHVYYHTKSAMRQAVRNAGIRRFIGKNDLTREIHRLDPEQQEFIKKETLRLEESFRGYSLHCGGVVFYPDGVPKDLLLGEKGHCRGLIPQIRLNKEDISREKRFKIDILSSRGLAQLYESNGNKIPPFDSMTTQKQLDPLALEMLRRGENIGITLAESPLIRKAFLKICPQSLHDIAVCLAIIRPAARDARAMDILTKDVIVFDDDAIEILAEELQCSDGEADRFRRGFAKGDSKIHEEFLERTRDHDPKKQHVLLERLKGLQRYSFCKSHAYSYAQLIYQLAVQKAHRPKAFWTATLNHCQSMYRRWVHYYEAKLVGVDYSASRLQKNDVSIYAKNRQNKMKKMMSVEEQMRVYGFWEIQGTDFFPDCYLHTMNEKDEKDETVSFRGIIATHRCLGSGESRKMIIFMGTGPHEYTEVVCSIPVHEKDPHRCFRGRETIGIVGHGVWHEGIITADEFCFF